MSEDEIWDEGYETALRDVMAMFVDLQKTTRDREVCRAIAVVAKGILDMGAGR
jgi:hypothetical protein